MKKILAIMFAMTIILGSIVLAETNSNETETNDTDNESYSHRLGESLNIRYEHLVCKVQLTNAQIDLLEKYIPEVNLSDNKRLLLKDLEELEDLKNGTNKTEFNKYLMETFKPHFIEASRDLTQAKKDFRSYNLTNRTKTEIISELKDIRSEYSGCISEKEEKMARLAYRHYNDLENRWEKKLDKLSRKGLDTTDLETLKKDIEARNAKLQELIESGDTKAVKEYMKELREESLHTAARFEIEALKQYNEKLKSEAEKSGDDRSFRDIEDKIADAEKRAQKGRKYEDNDREETWKSIKEANKEMRDISKDILKDRREQIKNDRGKNMRFENNNSDDDTDEDNNETEDDDREDD